jgi:hypothetical protein
MPGLSIIQRANRTFSRPVSALFIPSPATGTPRRALKAHNARDRLIDAGGCAQQRDLTCVSKAFSPVGTQYPVAAATMTETMCRHYKVTDHHANKEDNNRRADTAHDRPGRRRTWCSIGEQARSEFHKAPMTVTRTASAGGVCCRTTWSKRDQGHRPWHPRPVLAGTAQTTNRRR